MTEFKLLVCHIALVVAAGLALVSCETPERAATSKADRNDIAITVQWVAASEIDAVCKSAGASDGEHFEACAASGAKTCTIYAVQPRNFGDASALRAFGHESWHCFGARH